MSEFSQTDTDIRVTLARIEEKMDAQRTLISERLGGINARLDSLSASSARQGERIGKLESSEEHRRGERKVLTGIMAVVGAAFGFIGSLLLKMLGNGN